MRWGLASGLVLAGWAWLWFQSSGTDDAYITYAVADRLARTGQLVNYSGEAVEQSSSLLAVLVFASVSWITRLPAHDVGWVLALAAAAGCGVLVLCLRTAGGPRANGWAAAWLTVCGYFGYWAVSGMETSLFALCLLVWTLAHSRRLGVYDRSAYALAFLTAALLASVRPEACLIALSTLAAVAGLERYACSPHAHVRLRLLAINSLVAACLFAARGSYFGAWFPQPVTAKGHASLRQAIDAGIEYITGAPLLLPLWIGIAILARRTIQSAHNQRERRIDDPPSGSSDRLLAFTCLATLAFVVLVGGDWMGGGRFLAPIVPLAAFGTATVVLDIHHRGLRRLALAGVSGAMLFSAPLLARERATGLVAWADIDGPAAAMAENHSFQERRNRVHVRDLPLCARLPDLVEQVYERKRDRVWVLTGQGGMVLYHAQRRIPTEHWGVIDRRGLLDRHLTSSTTAVSWGKTRWGLTRRYDQLLDQLERVQLESDLPTPDIIYDLAFDLFEQRSLATHGYRPVYHQRGSVRSTDRVFPGRHLSAWITVYVHERYLEAARSPVTPGFEF